MGRSSKQYSMKNTRQNELIPSHLHSWKLCAHRNNTAKFARAYANKKYMWNPLKWFSRGRMEVGNGGWGWGGAQINKARKGFCTN